MLQTNLAQHLGILAIRLIHLLVFQPLLRGNDTLARARHLLHHGMELLPQRLAASTGCSCYHHSWGILDALLQHLHIFLLNLILPKFIRVLLPGAHVLPVTPRWS